MGVDDSRNLAVSPDVSVDAPLRANRWGRPQRCSGCFSRNSCVPALLKADDLAAFESVVQRRRILRAGATLYRQNEPCNSIYAVRSGSLKLNAISADGGEQVIGFYFPGHLVGFDSISVGKYGSSALALESTTVCEIPFDALCEQSRALPGLQTSFMRLMSSEITEEQKLLKLLGKGHADQRIAAFLLAMAESFHQRGLSAHRFLLPMPRTDIANYLGITIETASRWFSEFAHRGIIAAQRNDIALLDTDTLRGIAQGIAFDR